MPKRKMTSAAPCAKKPCLENTGTRKTGEKAIAAETMGGGCSQQTFCDVACDNNNDDPATSSADTAATEEQSDDLLTRASEEINRLRQIICVLEAQNRSLVDSLYYCSKLTQL